MKGDGGELPHPLFIPSLLFLARFARATELKHAVGEPLSRKSGRGRGPPQSGGRVRVACPDWISRDAARTTCKIAS